MFFTGRVTMVIAVNRWNCSHSMICSTSVCKPLKFGKITVYQVINMGFIVLCFFSRIAN